MKAESDKKEQDRLCIEAWRAFIGEFNALWEDKSSDEKYVDLKERAKINPHLNYRQREAIIARCDNVLNRTHGQTKRDEHYEHNKPSAKK